MEYEDIWGYMRIYEDIWGYMRIYITNLEISWSTKAEIVWRTSILCMYLVGGFKHFLFSISYMGCHPSHWRTHIFQRGRSTTNQLFSSESGAVIYCGAELRTGHGGVPGSADAEIDMLQPWWWCWWLLLLLSIVTIVSISITIIMVVIIIIMMVITTTMIMMMMMMMAAFFCTRDTEGITQTSQTVVLGYFMWRPRKIFNYLKYEARMMSH